MGTMFLIINDQPCDVETHRFADICAIGFKAVQCDPFAILYLRDMQGVWHKGEYCYSNQRHKFLPVGLAAVPKLILMMEVLKPCL